jgi:hypothetical protein
MLFLLHHNRVQRVEPLLKSAPPFPARQTEDCSL